MPAMLTPFRHLFLRLNMRGWRESILVDFPLLRPVRQIRPFFIQVINVTLEENIYEILFSLLRFLFCFSSLHAQKQTSIKRTNVKIVNPKLVLFQTTVKRLQTKLIEAKSIMSELQIQIYAINELNSNDML